MNDDNERIVQSKFLDYFSNYQFSGVQLIFNNRSLTFNYNEENKKYIDYLLLTLYDNPSIFIIFRTMEKNVSFTSDSISYEDLFKLIKEKMDTVKFNDMVDYSSQFSSELYKVYKVYDKFSREKIDLVMGIKNKENDKLFKLVSNNSKLRDTLISSGINIVSNSAYFRRNEFNDLSILFDRLIENPLVYYKNNDTSNMGFLNIFLFLLIDFISIGLGLFLLLK